MNSRSQTVIPETSNRMYSCSEARMNDKARVAPSDKDLRETLPEIGC